MFGSLKACQKYVYIVEKKRKNMSVRKLLIVDDSPTAPGAHADQKAVRPLSGGVVGLIGAFHGLGPFR